MSIKSDLLNIVYTYTNKVEDTIIVLTERSHLEYG